MTVTDLLAALEDIPRDTTIIVREHDGDGIRVVERTVYAVTDSKRTHDLNDPDGLSEYRYVYLELSPEDP